MTDPVTIVLLGEPVPMSHRSTKGGRVRYVAPGSRQAAAALQKAADQAMKENGQMPFNQPVKLELLCEVPIPRSWSKRKQAQAIAGELRVATRPDLTNMLKLAEDALKGVVWRDDSLVDEQHTKKRYSVQPKIVITVSA